MPESLRPLPRRTLGRTGEKLSIIGFGGIIVMNETPEFARECVARAVDRGVNYFDVAPTYGNAEERLGPALAPYRDRVFLACKTEQRTGPEARAALENSLRLARTDHFDLYQLHAITETADVDRIFAPGGVMDVLVKAREQGLIRHLGFSAHSHRAANRALDLFDFDTVLFPFSYHTWSKNAFGAAIAERAFERNMGLLALKAMARCKWPDDLPAEQRPWRKTWYAPLDRREDAALGLRFTLHLPVTAALPPGHWELFEMALDLAQSDALDAPLSAAEAAHLDALLRDETPIFDAAAANA